jgi:hypothetical protein
MDRVKGWLTNLFWGVAGNALWAGIAGGSLMTAITVVLAKIAARSKLISPAWADHAIWALVGIVVIGMLTALFSYLRFPARSRARRPNVLIPLPTVRTAEQWTALRATLEEVANRKYESGELLLDSTHFRNCTFTRMRLYYDGISPMAFTDCEFDEDTRRSIQSHSPLIAQWMEILRGLGWLREGAKMATLPLEDAGRAVKTPTAVPLPPELQAITGLQSVQKQGKELIRIVGRNFERQTVPIDGYEYVGCKFADVTFFFQGGNYRMNDCTLDGAFSLQSGNYIVMNTLALASSLDYFKPEIAKTYKEIAVKIGK